MSAPLAVLVGLGIATAATLWRTFNAMCQEEIRTRLCRLPSALIRLAALRLPRDVRSDLASEWLGELDFIVSTAEGLPVTRLLRGLGYAASLLCAAPSVARELTGAPRRRLMTAYKTIWTLILLAGVVSNAISALDAFTRTHHTAQGVSAATIALGSLICLLALNDRDRRREGLLNTAGCAVMAAYSFMQGHWWIALGIVFVIVAVVTLSLRRWVPVPAEWA